MKLLRIWFFLLASLSTVPASAHVAFTAPEHGATVQVGEPVTVSWVDVVVHDGVGYDLEYAGVVLAQGLPTTTQSFVWVPTAPCVCSLRVTQVNVGEDYVADIDVTVVGPPGSGTGGSGGSASAGAGSAGKPSGGAPTTPAGGTSAGGKGSGGASPGGTSSGGASSGGSVSGGAAGSSSTAGGSAGAPPMSEAGASWGGEPSKSTDEDSAAGSPSAALEEPENDGGAGPVDRSAPGRDSGCAVTAGRKTSDAPLWLLLAAATGFSRRRRSGRCAAPPAR